MVKGARSMNWLDEAELIWWGVFKCVIWTFAHMQTTVLKCVSNDVCMTKFQEMPLWDHWNTWIIQLTLKILKDNNSPTHAQTHTYLQAVRYMQQVEISRLLVSADLSELGPAATSHLNTSDRLPALQGQPRQHEYRAAGEGIPAPLSGWQCSKYPLRRVCVLLWAFSWELNLTGSGKDYFWSFSSFLRWLFRLFLAS